MKHGYETADKPTLVPVDLAAHRHKLIAEELEEYALAVEKEDLVQVADAIADLLYVVLGTAVVHGVNAEAVFNEVHRSNMTKTPLDPVTRKGGKGEGYEPPRIAEVLFVQTTNLDEANREAAIDRADNVLRFNSARAGMKV